MAVAWRDWAHVIVSTYGSWLPGDPRGFRDHGHRIHSTGSYRSPPPTGAHAGLQAFASARTGRKVVLSEAMRALVAEALTSKLTDMGHPVRIAAIDATHGHFLVRVGAEDAKPIVGRAKQRASLAARATIPGGLWAQGCHVVRISDEDHYHDVIKYIGAHQAGGALVWLHPNVKSRDVRVRDA